MDKHKDAVTCLDFKNEEQLCASCGDDGVIFIFNYNTHRQEGCLKLDPSDKEPESIKVCKFLKGTDILVSADLSGYLHFWCVTARTHMGRNQLMLSIFDKSKSDAGDGIANFPIRAMDYDPETKILYTGDEMGYMNKWDLTDLVYKLEEL
jgi:WD40 repeat protein